MNGIAEKLKDSLIEIMDIKSGDVALIVYDEYAREVMETTKKALEMVGVKVSGYKLPEAGRPLKKTPAELNKLLSELKPNLVFNQFKGIGEETPFRINLHHEESQYGARVGHSPSITIDMIKYPMTADFKAIKANSERLKEKFKGVKTVRLTTKKGTDLMFSIEGRDFRDDITIHPGEMGNLPSGEMWCAPVEHSMNGTIVCDGSIGDIGQVKEDLTIKVKGGYIVSLESKDKDLIRRVEELSSVDDEARLAGEFGIGLNPKARLTGILLEDEKVGGTLHIAFGANEDMPGGQNHSMTHRDYLFKEPSIINVDTGEYIMKDGKILI
ncbi:leucyl aminopeptidase [Methanocella sp. CWC-04]|uniref:Leucyl aminopeptidase n=1 Tax=Methanooceanicella nereidis TaxID=2052831 RepID=A0AAP2W6N1_9EURY|nr:aminopeptidase [Methanocella sp. CWC-04]MCD1295467.1 leucyl aminopeptidase [Methanocella sp. CWC-04]